MAIKSIIPVKVNLKTTMTQDGKTDQYVFKEPGQLATLANGQHYLRYLEHQAGQATPVQFRLSDDEIHLIRNGSQKTHFIFKPAYQHVMPYQTEYGKIYLQVVTDQMQTKFDLTAGQGDLKIRYRLLMQDQLIGNYDIQLQFSI